MLFFDEADAIFGKRSDVHEAKDKYANTEVSYILQRIEQYDGIVILATNYRKNIDEAFMRRIRYVVEFSLPDARLRKNSGNPVFPMRFRQNIWIMIIWRNSLKSPVGRLKISF